MAKKIIKSSVRKDGDSKLFAFLAAFLSILGFIIALLFRRNNRYVMFYAKQSLVIFIGYLIGVVAGWLPLIGDFVSGVIDVIVIVLWIITWIFALSGKEKYTPLIGQYADKIDL